MNALSRSSLITLAVLLVVTAPLSAVESTPAVDRLPQAVTTVAPKYPYLMRHQGVAAEVTVAFKVDVKGNVTGAKILTCTNYEFIAATLDAIKKWTFTPAIKDGKPVGMRVHETFTFRVKEQAAARNDVLIARGKRAR